MNFSQTTILLVDDMAEIRESLKEFFMDYGAQKILEAENGRKALEILHHQENAGEPVQLILCDWQMPLLDGLGFLAEMKEKEKFLMIPLIMISGEYGDREKALLAKRLGANRCLAKPFQCATLLETIEKVLNEAQILCAFQSILKNI